MRKSVFLFVSAALVVVGGAGVYAMTSRGQPEAAAYFSDVVRIGDIEQAVAASGELRPLEVIDVGVEASGQVESLHVGPGDQVVAGQVLGQIDPFLMQNALRNAENQLGRIQRGRTFREAGLRQAVINLQRQQSLRERDFSTSQAFENAQLQVRTAENALAQLALEIQAAELNVEARRADLNQLTIVAPISGVVSEVLAPKGALVSNRRGSPIVLRIAKLDTMTVRVPVSEADVVKVKQGQKVYFTTLSEPDRRYETTLRAVEVAPANGGLELSNNAATRPAVYYNALFDVPNHDGQLLPAMTAEVKIVLGEAEQVPLMPTAALGPREADGRFSVQVVEPDGDLVQKSVSIGLTDGLATEVRDGLKVGDRIVTGQAVEG